MAWQLTGTGDERLIMDVAYTPPIVVGSAKLQGETVKGWHIEILWSGRHGDITFDAPTLMMAQAFIAGVERTVEAMEMG